MVKRFQIMIYDAIRWFCPPVMVESVLRLAATVRMFFYSNKKVEEIRRNTALVGRRKSKRAYIMATGPSIKAIDLSGISDADFLSVSNFFLHSDVNQINLVAHFFANYHAPLILGEYVDWLAAADSVLPRDTAMCLSYDVKKMVEENDLFVDREVFYFSFEKELSLFGLALNRPFQSPHTSPIFLLGLAIAMGYEEIFLCGCDHTALRDYGGEVRNFYNQNEEMRRNATSGARWDSGIKFHLRNLMDTIRQYEQLHDIAKSRSIRVVNLSNDSWLEMFPRE